MISHFFTVPGQNLSIPCKALDAKSFLIIIMGYDKIYKSSFISDKKYDNAYMRGDFYGTLQ